MRRNLLLLLVLVGCGGDNAKTPDAKPAIDAAIDAPAVAQTCANYCNEIMTNCTGPNAQYTAMGNCLGACAAFPMGTAADTTGNTLGCRIYHAGTPSMTTPTTHCIHAGPGGDQVNKAGTCGDPCTSFCTIEIKTCGSIDTPLTGITPQYQNMGACMTACGNFDKTHLYVFNGTPATPTGDSLACRLYHVTNAASNAVANPPNLGMVTAHCGHSGPAGGANAATCMAGTTPAP